MNCKATLVRYSVQWDSKKVVSKISFITFGNRGQFSTHFLRMHQIDSVTKVQEYYEYFSSTTIIHAKLSKKCNLCSDLVQLMSRVKIMLFTWIRKIFMTLHFISSSFYLLLLLWQKEIIQNIWLLKDIKKYDKLPKTFSVDKIPCQLSIKPFMSKVSNGEKRVSIFHLEACKKVHFVISMRE